MGYRAVVSFAAIALILTLFLPPSGMGLRRSVLTVCQFGSGITDVPGQ